MNPIFSIFNGNAFFCLEIVKELKCVNWEYKKIENIQFKKYLISINDNYLELNSLDSIILFLTPVNSKEIYPLY